MITILIVMAGALDTRGVQFWFMAVGHDATIPPVLIAFPSTAQRHIVQGLTLGVVKGRSPLSMLEVSR